MNPTDRLKRLVDFCSNFSGVLFKECDQGGVGFRVVRFGCGLQLFWRNWCSVNGLWFTTWSFRYGRLFGWCFGDGYLFLDLDRLCVASDQRLYPRALRPA